MQSSLKLQVGQSFTMHPAKRLPPRSLMSTQPFPCNAKELAYLFLLWTVGFLGRHLAGTNAIEDSNPASHPAGCIEIALQRRQVQTTFAVLPIVTRDAVIDQECLNGGGEVR